MRGTIGGKPGEALTPIDIVQLVSAFAEVIKQRTSAARPRVLLGRDGRVTGPTIQQMVEATLIMSGIEVIDLGLTTTPTLSTYVPHVYGAAGVMISASHNPMTYNALKFFDETGAFISPEVGKQVMDLADAQELDYADVTSQGISADHHRAAVDYHVDAICSLNSVDVEAIRAAGFHVTIDAINSTGSIAIPALLDALGVEYDIIHGEINGTFAHNPEPLEGHLEDLQRAVRRSQTHLGIAVDPDVDRLAFVGEDGNYLGEEYTLVMVADYLLQKQPGPVVSNMSSSRALRDIAERHGQPCHSAKVGEYHVVQKMKSVGAVLGGEGNGGIILPELHFGRDALVGIAFMLSYMATSGKSASSIRAVMPEYHMYKAKMSVATAEDKASILSSFHEYHAHHPGLHTQDGIKVDFDAGWVHVRQSNTEPILRIYTEASTLEEARQMAHQTIEQLNTYA